jgi:DNA-binding transcriptional regulator YiaG
MFNAEEVKSIRDKLGYTQAELATKCGVTVTTVSRWETGKSSPDRRAQVILLQFAKSAHKIGNDDRIRT